MLFAYLHFNALLIAVPLIIIFALLYAATRHERMVPIFRHAGKIAFWTFAVLALIFVILRVTT